MNNRGYFGNGLPYTVIGKGPKPLVVFEGLTFAHKPQPPAMVKMYSFLSQDYTIYSVLRLPQPPNNYSLDDMANDYALMIREDFNAPVDIIGISTGGSVALHFAALHPSLVRRLVIHSSAHTLNDRAKQLQLDVARAAENGNWGEAWRLLIGTGFTSPLAKPLVSLLGFFLSLDHPKNARDLVVTVEAEDNHAFLDHIDEITCPTLVAGGEDDFFYSPELFRETAQGIFGARLCLYPHMGHPAKGRQFKEDVLAFLMEA